MSEINGPQWQGIQIVKAPSQSSARAQNAAFRVRIMPALRCLRSKRTEECGGGGSDGGSGDGGVWRSWIREGHQKPEMSLRG